ncbi:uncharacterized protein LOC129613206 isoform X2 [Condylostylus longicornis]|uniref:uncharacterized protein LOC129613206 isoform X2 n=1 Tax=Condylostylus longicornis TaxID=2530218 RepID=UPI00244E1E22|nr:uncharacterized protein LOC129613206 isoform X2 [Condylostylus longicornis]
MSYIGSASDVEQEKNLNEFHQNLSKKLLEKTTKKKMSSTSANKNNERWHDNDSEISDSETFLAKGAFLLTPSYELSMERAALICEKMSFKGCFSLTKTATGILFKFSHPDDYQAVFKKGFHKVTGARFYKKVAVPCRPQKTFTLYVLDVPEDIPVEDIRHALYKFNSVVEVVRLVVSNVAHKKDQTVNEDGTATPVKDPKPGESLTNKEAPPPLIRVTLASLDEFNILLQNGLNFYDATFFPTDANLPVTAGKIVYKRSYASGHVVTTYRDVNEAKEPSWPRKSQSPIHVAFN